MDSGLLLVSLCLLAGTVTLEVSGSADACPERLLAKERQRTCPRTCKIDKDCDTKRHCLCDGQCGLSCVVPGRTCPWPLAPSGNSVASLLSPNYAFSALLEVRCSPGFKLPNGLDAAIRRCQGNQQWSGEEPICSEVPSLSVLPDPTCPLPDEVLSKFSIQGSAAMGTSIRYSCLSGADIVGSNENFCQENQTWQHPHPTCQKVFCEPSKAVKDGYVVAVEMPKYQVGFVVHYLCRKNFLLDGAQKVTCLSNGNWSAPPPYCRARCLLPGQRSRVVINGEKRWPFDVTDAMVAHGENVQFFCKHPHKPCSFTATQICLDGNLQPPDCYLEPTWLQYKLFPHRLVSEIDACQHGDVE